MFRQRLKLWLVFVLGAIGPLAFGDELTCAPKTGVMTIGPGQIAYIEAGQGRPVVMLHGLFAQKEQWAELLCMLAQANHRVVAIDLPGFGQSDGYPDDVYKLAAQAELVNAFIQNWTQGSVDLAGNSMGGAIATLLAASHPESVRTLAFIGAPMGFSMWGRELDAALAQGVNPFIPTTIDEVDLELSFLFATPPQLLRAEKQKLVDDYRVRLQHFQRIWSIVTVDMNLLRKVNPLDLPTLVLWGEEDRIFEIEGAPGIRSTLVNAVVEPLPGVGHLPMLEALEVVYNLYDEFLQKH